MRHPKITVSVIGNRDSVPEVDHLAYEVGKIIAKVDAILVCGGLRGAMEAAAKGAKDMGGFTVGLLPGSDKADANPYIDLALPTSIGFARNALVACAADIIVALPGSHGTLSEICYGLVFNRPVIDLGSWNREGMIKVKDVQEAEKKIRELIKKIKYARTT